MIKLSVHQEDTTIINTYAPSMRIAKYIKQILTDLKKEIHNNTIIVGDFHNPLPIMDKLDRKSIKKC